ncbi:MAG TPA: SgcJ/EcaC family oxidoreductase [Candidatus Acidoferrales bacterium]|nr:SgcJ/EcaC family oxidoreductase [Candidatus Acidoferrales bacterium]
MWNRRFAGLLSCAVVCATLIAACSTGTGDQPQPQVAVQPADTRASDEAAIRAASAAWSQASTAKDIDKAVSFYGDGAVVMSPKAPAVHGSENIRKGWAEGFATPGPGLSWRTTAVEVARSGDLAYENGTYDFVTTGKDGKTSDEKGKYLVIWKKQADGAWKVAVDMDNTDQ